MLDTSFAFITISVLGAPILIIINLLFKKRLIFHVISVLALIYGGAVISVTFFPMPIDQRLIADMKTSGVVLSYNLIPFKSISGSLNHFYYMVGIRNVLGNLLLLLPFGALLWIVKVKTVGRALLYGLLVSLAIEAMQLAISLLSLGIRSADVDDLILNSAGTLIGFLLCRSVYQIVRSIRRTPVRDKSLSNRVS
ncbi:VanZ family protein [Paenibacillus sp. CF384]|uniref:VanZ family protein n=1 Tax=Paenibacillus sp. CF384 TaxID=1884382 RepID=UPI00089AB4A1|nr:VanZ family protein [Paenibacillus sp. CF384]SDX06359.1 Glycopeptide antibiotics resistance protein [Paenibacillus sp. CF384]